MGVLILLPTGLHPSASSCDIQCKHTIDDTHVVSDELSMMAREIHRDSTVATVKGQHLHYILVRIKKFKIRYAS
jgi:hypothetical protein